MPILTPEDEIDLAKFEVELVKNWNKMIGSQKSVTATHMKLSDLIIKENSAREVFLRTARDVYKQMKVLAREKMSNIDENDGKIIQKIIHDNELIYENNKKFLNAIKDLGLQREYLHKEFQELTEALKEVSSKRKAVVHKALKIEISKNKLIEGEKLEMLDQEFKNIQKEFDRSKGRYLKKVEHIESTRNEVNSLWNKLKDSTMGFD